MAAKKISVTKIQLAAGTNALGQEKAAHRHAQGKFGGCRALKLHANQDGARVLQRRASSGRTTGTA
jgi:hypothetical protein